MLKLIGIKRTMLLGVLVAVNIALAAILFLMIVPMQLDAESELSAVNGQISALQNKIQNVKAELVLFKENLPKYEALQQKGFFTEQDRFRISRELDAIRGQAGISGFSYEIGDVLTIKNANADTAKMRLVDSRIQISNVTTVMDVGFYRFLQMMQAQFPSHIRLMSFSIRRAQALKQEQLLDIAAGKMPMLIAAEATFDWLTMVPLPPPQVDPVTGLPMQGGQR